MGWSISLNPNRAHVLAALYEGVRLDPANDPFAGAPERLVWDNGLEFVAGDVTSAAIALGSIPSPTLAWSPTSKGKVERLNRTLDDELFSTLPSFVDGPKRENGRPLIHTGEGISFELFVQQFADYVEHYNFRRPHSALNGMTPKEKWEADATPLRIFDDASLRWMIQAQESRKVLNDGISFKARRYWAQELNGMVGDRVIIKYVPHDGRQIEVFDLDGDYLCTARPQGALSKAEALSVVKARRAHEATVRKLAKRPDGAFKRAFNRSPLARRRLKTSW